MISVITEADPWCGDTREEVVIHSGLGAWGREHGKEKLHEELIHK